MATEFKCDYCTAALDKNATLVHTERYHGLWDLDCSICPDCFKHFRVMLEKAKSQKSWTGWTALEHEVASLKKETESLKSELQFLRHEDPTREQLLEADPHYEVLRVASERGTKIMEVHRSILISRSAVFKKFLTPEDFTRHRGWYPHQAIKLPIKLPCVPTHPDSFVAFIQFLYTAQLEPEILKKHAPELMKAGNKNAIELLTRKCEDYIVNNMTAESTINCLKVASAGQCNSTAITAAAVKQILSNPTVFVNRKDFQALKNDISLFEAFKYVMLDQSSRKKEEKLKGSKPGSGPGSEPGSVSGSDPFINSVLPRDPLLEASFSRLGMCSCSVHPFAHAAHAALDMGTKVVGDP